MNVLVIMTDQQRADHLGCTGNPIVSTPNIDRLASGGMVFSRHYVSNPLCMPSRATLLTGMTPRGHGVRTNGINLSRDVSTITGRLSERGYDTHVVGKLHLRNFCRSDPTGGEDVVYRDLRDGRGAYGFRTGEVCIGHGPWVGGAYHDWLLDKLDGRPNPWHVNHPEKGCGAQETCYTEITPDLHHSSWVAERTIDFLRNRDQERPFFLQCSFPDPHHPYCPPDEYAAMYERAAIPLPARRDGELDDLPPHFAQAYHGAHPFAGRAVVPTAMTDEQTREVIRLTYGMISLIDTSVGRVLDALDELGLADDTLVIFTSDHGDLMGDHRLLNKGPFHFEGLLRVPFIARWPGVIPSGARTQSLTSHLDFAPTILDALGVPIPEGPTPAEPVCPEQRAPWPGKSLMPILRDPSASVQESVLVENDEDYIGSNLRTLIARDWKLTCYSDRDFGEMFDLRNDPDELHNLWDGAGYREVKRDLKDQLLARIMSTDSALPRRLTHA